MQMRWIIAVCAMAIDPAAVMAPDLGPKVAIAPGGSDTSCTFVFLREDHTLGNTLRYILNQDPSVEFAGYARFQRLRLVINLITNQICMVHSAHLIAAAGTASPILYRPSCTFTFKRCQSLGKPVQTPCCAL